VTVRATDRAGNATTVDVPFTLDSPAPSVLSLNLAAAADTAPVGDRETTAETVTLTGLTDPNAIVFLVETGETATAGATGRFSFADVPLSAGPNVFHARVSDGLNNTRETTLTVTRLDAPAAPITLTEGTNFATEQAVPVVSEQTGGSRTLSFDVSAAFDTADTTTAAEDVFAVYLVDAADRSQALLHGDEPGTPVFLLKGTQAEFTPGVVRYDGKRVQIDVMTVTGVEEGRLVFQLLNSDADTGPRSRCRTCETPSTRRGRPARRFRPRTRKSRRGRRWRSAARPCRPRSKCS